MADVGVSPPPRKPWEGVRTAAPGPSPFRPASDSSNTAAVVESAGLANSPDALDGAMVSGPTGYSANYNQYNNNAYAMNSSHGTYNNHNRGYGFGGGMSGGGYGLGNSFNGRMYGNNYGGSMYGGGYMGGLSTGMGVGGPGPPQIRGGDPNNPFQGSFPQSPPLLWQSALQKMHSILVVFSNIVSLISENTHTFNVIMTSLYTFLDRSGVLAGFVLRLLRMLRKSNLRQSNASKSQIKGPRSL